MLIKGLREAYREVFEDKEEYYREKVKLALDGKIGNSGLIHPEIILVINSKGYVPKEIRDGQVVSKAMESGGFISKAMIYAVLEGFSENKDKIDISWVLEPHDPLEILRASKTYIDEVAV